MAGFNSMPALSSGATPRGPDAMAMTASDMEAFGNTYIPFDESLLWVNPFPEPDCSNFLRVLPCVSLSR